MSKKDKIQHDLDNALVIINNITQSMSKKMEILSTEAMKKNYFDREQVEIFNRSMETIREQTAIIKNLFNYIE